MGNVNKNEEIVVKGENKEEVVVDKKKWNWKKYMFPVIGFIAGAVAGVAGDRFLMNRSKTTTETEDTAA